MAPRCQGGIINLLRRMESRPCPVLIVATKGDLENRDESALAALLPDGTHLWCISARTGHGVSFPPTT